MKKKVKNMLLTCLLKAMILSFTIFVMTSILLSNGLIRNSMIETIQKMENRLNPVSFSLKLFPIYLITIFCFDLGSNLILIDIFKNKK